MILVTGATGFLGKRVCKKLSASNQKFVPTSKSMGVDLTDQKAVQSLFEKVRPTHVLNCAAFVGGIQFGYLHPAELFSINMRMGLNLLDSCKSSGVQRLVNPVSNCAYPAKATLFKESEFWDGPIHESVLAYGGVRKALWVASWAYGREYDLDIISLILSNMYGPEDHFEESRSHALGALIMKFTEAKVRGDRKVVVWGTGKPVREWLHVDDAAEALIRSLDIAPTLDPINVGVSSGISVTDMATLIADAVGYQGAIEYDTSKPDGAHYKTVDGPRGKELLQWSPQVPLQKGIQDAVKWYIENRNSIRQGH